MYTAKLILHRGKSRIAVYFEHHITLISLFKKLKGAQLSKSPKVWHLPNTSQYRARFKLQASKKQLQNEAHQTVVEKFAKWLKLNVTVTVLLVRT